MKVNKTRLYKLQEVVEHSTKTEQKTKVATSFLLKIPDDPTSNRVLMQNIVSNFNTNKGMVKIF